MSWNKRVKEPTAALTADIATANREKAEAITQRSLLTRSFEFLAERRQLNNFGDELELTFIPKERHA